MKLRRFEILLPLVYNDGTEIEKEKFDQTNEELLSQFGAVTFDSVIASGHWLYKGVLYQDQLIRLRVDTRELKNARNFLKKYKQVLKKRFRQIDIWITAHDIEIL